MQLTTQPLGPAEEDTAFAGSMDLADGTEHHIPVGAAEIGRCAQACDRVRVAGVEDDVGGFGGGDLGGEILHKLRVNDNVDTRGVGSIWGRGKKQRPGTEEGKE